MSHATFDRSCGAKRRLTMDGAGRWLVLALAMILAALLAPPSFAATNTLQSVKTEALAGGGFRLTLTLSGNAPKPRAFAIQDPPSISVDLMGTHNGLSKRFRNLEAGNARSVAAVQADGRTRVVVQLTHSAPYSVSRRGHHIYLTVGSSARSQVQAASLSSGQSAAGQGSGLDITGVDFHRGENGAGRVIVGLSNANAAVDVHHRGDKVLVDFHSAHVPQRLVRRMDVIDFATPVKYIDTRQKGNGVQMVITPVKGAKYERVAYQTGKTFTLELQPKQSAANQKKHKKRFTGQRISLNFQDIKIRSVLQIIADVAHVNMVVSDSVHGSMALRLNNVPWDQALDIILRTQGLGQSRQGNVILVAPLKELAAQRAAELAASKQQQKLEPLQSTIIQVNYAKAKNIAALLKSNSNSFLSSRGKVSVDTRTNTLLVEDTAQKLAQIRKLVKRLDVPVKQVLIEARVVIATSDYAKDLGSQFGVSFANAHFGTSGSASAANQGLQSGVNSLSQSIASSSSSGTGTSSSGSSSGTSALTDLFNVALPAAPTAGTASKMAFAILGSNYLVNLELSALQAEGRGEVVSSPHVIAANGQEATIEQGTEIPYQASTSSGATNVQFKKAVLSLKVTPQITPDGRIVMDLIITKDSVGKQVSNSQGGTVPSIDTHKVTTQVMVNNGDTVVLGGIYENSKNNNQTKVPLLGDIPLLGYLFRQKHVDTSRSELLIFVTPRIMNPSMDIN